MAKKQPETKKHTSEEQDIIKRIRQSQVKRAAPPDVDMGAIVAQAMHAYQLGREDEANIAQRQLSAGMPDPSLLKETVMLSRAALERIRNPTSEFLAEYLTVFGIGGISLYVLYVMFFKVEIGFKLPLWVFTLVAVAFFSLAVYLTYEYFRDHDDWIRSNSRFKRVLSDATGAVAGVLTLTSILLVSGHYVSYKQQKEYVESSLQRQLGAYSLSAMNSKQSTGEFTRGSLDEGLVRVTTEKVSHDHAIYKASPNSGITGGYIAEVNSVSGTMYKDTPTGETSAERYKILRGTVSAVDDRSFSLKIRDSGRETTINIGEASVVPQKGQEIGVVCDEMTNTAVVIVTDTSNTAEIKGSGKTIESSLSKQDNPDTSKNDEATNSPATDAGAGSRRRDEASGGVPK
jgi:hypothetical protein